MDQVGLRSAGGHLKGDGCLHVEDLIGALEDVHLDLVNHIRSRGRSLDREDEVRLRNSHAVDGEDLSDVADIEDRPGARCHLDIEENAQLGSGDVEAERAEPRDLICRRVPASKI